MLIFISIAIAAFIIAVGSFMFGHDHDFDHDHDHGGGHGDHDAGSGEATISIFSTKVIATLLMGFGAAGAIAIHYGASTVIASLVGLGSGVVLGGIMYFSLELIYRQQCDSLVPTSAAIGRTGMVTVSIGDGTSGEVGINLDGDYRTFTASSTDGKAIAKGQTIQVVKTMGSHVVVEREI